MAFATMGIPLVSGREFARADDEKAALVAIVNETMAAKYWRGRNPIAAAALGSTRLLGSLLYKVSPRDPLAFGSAFVVMTIASLQRVFCLPGA